MSPVLAAGVAIVHLALVAYGVGIFREQRSHRVTRATLRWLQAGVVLDVTATVCMIAASSRGLTLHALLGFSSLAAMAVETGLAWRHRSAVGDAPVSPGLHRYSRIAYGWWLVSYVTGAYLVISAAG